jgi:hypothetical protein
MKLKFKDYLKLNINNNKLLILILTIMELKQGLFKLIMEFFLDLNKLVKNKIKLKYLRLFFNYYKFF